jgi:hypothetical protein
MILASPSSRASPGERIGPNAPSQRFYEMTLKGVGDSDWPARGAITPH